jgi:TnpA family transposase
VYLTQKELSERILLSIYGFGTNIGLKHICSGNPHITYNQLRHIKNYFLSANNLKNAIQKIINALFASRDHKIWGEMPIAVAGDSTQFSAYFQNMISEYHNRYGGRGVMIYWHVEKKATCIYSQLKSVSSSEVAAMIGGILNHCTEMSVQKSYVDTHGQSEIGFAFSHLLGFKLMPRLANINKQKLYQCAYGDYQKYGNLQPILSDTIKWESIKDYYYQMVKYSVAMKEGYATPESILRRFTKNNLTHPIYSALSQLGKVIKTIFVCHYLMHESLRQEIQEGLNVVELWNGVSKFIFYGRAGEISTNKEKSQELAVLSLHLLQLSMVYVNTMMIQQIIYEQNLIDKLTHEDKRAITPLIYEHINPYGLFFLDLSHRLPHIKYGVAV